MSDVERRIQGWKAGFASSEALRRADVEELEQHVRDALPSLIASGLSAEEAFLIATRRVGPPEAIEREFAKVNGTHLWSQRAFWIIVGALGYVVCRLLIGAAASLTQVMVGVAGGSGTDMGSAGVAITGAGWITVAAVLYYGREQGLAPMTLRSAGSLTVGMTLLLVVAASMNFAGEVVLFQLLPVADAARGRLITNVATWIVAVLVPLFMFAMMLQMRGQASAAE